MENTACRFTEANILEDYASGGGYLSEDEGLRLELDACDKLEAQTLRLGRPEAVCEEDEPLRKR